MLETDLSRLDSALEELASQGRSALLPALHAAQDIHGYIPEAAALEIGRILRVPLAEIHGVIDFYTLFQREPPGRTVIHVCNDPVCAMAGSEAFVKTLHRHQDTDGLTVHCAPCLGLCEHAPAVMVREAQRGHIDPGYAGEVTAAIGQSPRSILGGELALLTANCGKGRATTRLEYEASGGYRALREALQGSPGKILAEIKASGLVGRGGAAFPTGLKWEGAAQAAGETKFVICNGDEAEPGTFKDRVLLEEDPHRVLEGLLLAAYATGASKGYVFIRGEYTRALRAMTEALAEARQAGYLGTRILGSGFSLDVELRRGAGAYVCGEETALFEAIEGRRGFPRVKPPFPTTHGLFGKPTVINNVETLVNVPLILNLGAAEYRKLGTEKSSGPKLFCVSGDVARPGLYEVPFGVTLRHLLEDLAGGLRSGHRLQAILFGGAAGAFATPGDLDVKLSFEDLRSAGLPLGSGVVMVFDESRDLRDVLLRLARFFAQESCGKCFPCQLGTQRQLEILERIATGRMLPGDTDRLTDVGWTMTDASLCGLGQTAASAVLSALRLWPELFRQE
jgi:NADH-quinone oxidoreductase subunit F